jgi:Amt family ammonium transporter
MVMFGALNAVGLLRVSKQGELIGLDIDQHGITAYPEYEISGESGHIALSPDVG